MSDEFLRVASLSELQPGSMLAFDVDGDQRLLVRTDDGELRALDGVCSHEEAYLIEGDLEETTIWCPLHAAGFDVNTGAPLCGPALTGLACYQVRTEGDDVVVSREPTA